MEARSCESERETEYHLALLVLSGVIYIYKRTHLITQMKEYV